MSGRWRSSDGPEEMIDSVSARDRTLTGRMRARWAVELVGRDASDEPLRFVRRLPLTPERPEES